MGKTSIEWATDVWNPVTGCSPVSEGCANCYAARFAKRLAGRCGYPKDDPFKVTLHPERLSEPLRWRKPRRVFVCSMGDLFHPSVPFEFINRVWTVMLVCNQHTFMVLTKRPERMRQFFAERHHSWLPPFHSWQDGPDKPPAHIRLGVSVENQRTADERIPVLLQTPAAKRFVSCEPLLGAVGLMNVQFDRATIMNALEGCGISLRSQAQSIPNAFCNKLDWVIAGGETGPGARPSHPDWVRGLRDQCQAAGVPFFFKSWGSWLPDNQCKDRPFYIKPGHPGAPKEFIDKPVCHLSPGLHAFKVGKKAAGRLLDGREWDEIPC